MKNSLLKNILNKVAKYLLQYLECYGVKFEYQIPPEFIVSIHGQTRMMERFKCNKNKIKKITQKAWGYGGSVFVPNKLKQKHKPVRGVIEYRYYFGYIFVFNVIEKNNYSLKILVTLYRHKNKKKYVKFKNHLARLSNRHR